MRILAFRTLALVLATALGSFLPLWAQEKPSRVKMTPFGQPVVPRLSAPAWSLPQTPVRAPGDPVPIVNPFQSRKIRIVDTAEETLAEPIVPHISPLTLTRTPNPILSFEGINLQNGGSGIPPDTVGDVGPNHYVQMVNSSFAIFDKNGRALAGPTNINALWNDGTVCQTTNPGDPIVLYDRFADRWMMTQFGHASSEQGPVAPYFQCIAVSQTPDPTGAWWTYSFDTTSTETFNDYGKFGVWPDGYYMGANEGGFTAYVFDRTNMLLGATARPLIRGNLENGNMMLPSDLDGPTPPPAGSPNYFYTMVSNSEIQLWAARVDWDNRDNSDFSPVAQIPSPIGFLYDVCPAKPTQDDSLDCIPQQGTIQTLDAIGEWPMFRFQYRNHGTYESLLGNFTVDMNGATDADHAGLHWFELRRVGGGPWTLYQEGNYAPDGNHRWMGSIAMDKRGNIALGYSVSGDGLFPAIRYATRESTDPLGRLGAEVELVGGTAPQTDANRWGDYSSMNVDPTDDCTFWFTSEYLADSAQGWRTRIGSFRLESCLEQSTTTTTIPGATTTTTVTSTTTTTTAVTTTTTTTTGATTTTTTIPGGIVTRRYFPLFTVDSTQNTGFAVVNLAATTANLSFRAYSGSGTLMGTAQRTLPPGQQLAQVLVELFPNIASAQGWILLESNVAEVEGFFLLFDNALTVMDGATASAATQTSFFLPAGDDALVFLTNPSNSPVSFSLDYLDDEGFFGPNVQGSIPALGQVGVQSSALRPPGAVGGTLFYSGGGVVAFALVGTTNWIGGLNGISFAPTGSTLFAPQYAYGGGFVSVLDIVNYDESNRTIALRLIGDDGVQIGSTGVVTLQSLGGSVRIVDPGIFGLVAGSDLIQGYVRLDGDGGNFNGWVRFSDPAGAQFGSALQFVGAGQTNTYFSQVAQDGLFFTGVAALNPNAVPANVTVTVFNTSGGIVAQGAVQIPAGGRFSKVLFQLVGAFPPLSRGYFRLSSDVPISSFALFGTNDIRVLSAVPPQTR